jgi:protoporphyrinogen oxidase
LYLVVSPYWKPLERVTAHEWLVRWMGSRAYRALWEPMLIGKFGEGTYQQVNMAWLWARLHKRSPRLGTFAGGFQAFFDLLAEAVSKQGGEIRFNTAVTQITNCKSQIANNNQLLVSTADEEAVYDVVYDVVIVTTSPHVLARLAPELPPSYTEQLLALKSMGSVVLVLALEHPLSEQGYYWHNLPKEAGFPFLALVEHTNYVGREHFGGDHIVYCGDYLDPEHEYFRLSKEELLARFLPQLARFNPKFEPGWVKGSWLFKETYAQPVPPVNHSRNIPELRTPIPGLYLASMSQVYPWDRGTNYAVELGRRVAGMVMGVT